MKTDDKVFNPNECFKLREYTDSELKMIQGLIKKFSGSIKIDPNYIHWKG